MSNLEAAIALATHAHQGQTDKAGTPYILHPFRIMQRMDSEEAKMVAVLHDVVEDTSVTLKELRAMNFSETVVASLTRRTEESYEAFIERVKLNPLARKVKLADLEDNMNLQRLQHITNRDKQRWQRYAKAAGALSA